MRTEGQAGGNNNSNTYVVTVQAIRRRRRRPTAMREVTVNVTNVDEPGKVTLTALQPVDGINLTATQ